ncbi:MAG: trypsin-like serine peptidase [Paracoccaceae bacterium]
MIRALVLLFSLMAMTAHAQTSGLRTLDTENAAHAWRAVGRLDLGRSGFCSATLIAPDLVLTAAHCLYPKGSATPFEAGDIVFHAGLRNGKAAMSRRFSAVAAHAAFKPNMNLSPENIQHDVALLRLAEPISPYEISPFQVHGDAVDPGPVSVVSYGRGRANAQSRQRECQFLDKESAIYVFDCDVTFGSSGAPVFSHLNGRGRIMSIISGMTYYKGEKVALGMALPQRVAELKRQLRIGLGATQPRAQVRRLGVGQGRSSTGAKFVRPANGS